MLVLLYLFVLPVVAPQLPFTTTSSTSTGLVGTAHANGGGVFETVNATEIETSSLTMTGYIYAAGMLSNGNWIYSVGRSTGGDVAGVAEINHAGTSTIWSYRDPTWAAGEGGEAIYKFNDGTYFISECDAGLPTSHDRRINTDGSNVWSIPWYGGNVHFRTISGTLYAVIVGNVTADRPKVIKIIDSTTPSNVLWQASISDATYLNGADYGTTNGVAVVWAADHSGHVLYEINYATKDVIQSIPFSSYTTGPYDVVIVDNTHVLISLGAPTPQLQILDVSATPTVVWSYTPSGIPIGVEVDPASPYHFIIGDDNSKILSIYVTFGHDFGVISTGSTSYTTTTTDTIGNTVGTTNGPNVLFGYAITASASGNLSSSGVNVKTAAGSIRVGIYSGYNGTSHKFTGLLGQSASTAEVGWNDPTVTGVSIIQSATYYLVFVLDDSGAAIYADGSSGTEYYGAFTYGTLTDPSATVTSDTTTANMRMTYGQINGHTLGTRLQYTGTTCTSCVASFSFDILTYTSGDKIILALYSDSSGNPDQELWNSNLSGTDCGATGWCKILEPAGTVDNSWNVGLTNGAYYWFMYQWNSVDAGPSYVSGGAASSGIDLPQSFGTLLSAWSGGLLSAKNWGMYLTYSVANSASPSDLVSQLDSLGRNFISVRSWTDSDSVTDLIGRLHSVSNTLSDVVAWQDTLTRQFVGSKLLSDQLTLIDSSSIGYHTVGPPPGTSISFLETQSLTDALSPNFIGQRTLTGTLSLTDSLTNLRNVPEAFSDVFSSLDVLTFHYAGQLSLSDIIAFTDSIGQSTPRSAILSDTLSLIDSLTRLQNTPSIGNGGSNWYYSLVVRVLDTNGTPVQGAAVSIPNQAILTNSNGLADFGQESPGTYMMHVVVSGCNITDAAVPLQSDLTPSNPATIKLTGCQVQPASTPSIWSAIAGMGNYLMLAGVAIVGIVIIGALIIVRKLEPKSRWNNRR